MYTPKRRTKRRVRRQEPIHGQAKKQRHHPRDEGQEDSSNDEEYEEDIPDEEEDVETAAQIRPEVSYFYNEGLKNLFEDVDTFWTNIHELLRQGPETCEEATGLINFLHIVMGKILALKAVFDNSERVLTSIADTIFRKHKGKVSACSFVYHELQRYVTSFRCGSYVTPMEEDVVNALDAAVKHICTPMHTKEIYC